MRFGNLSAAFVSTAAVCGVLALTGCSDDVVCPEPGPDAVPLVSARVVEKDDASGTGTYVSVFCTADPLPELYVVSITQRQIDEEGQAQEPGLVLTLEDSLVVWQPGSPCSLKVTTDYGFASASETVPASPEVSAPATIATGESLPLSWVPVDGADYYIVSAVVMSVTVRDTSEVVFATRETFFELPSDYFESEGVVSGQVDAVAGPFIEGGSEGNVSGAGSGFFTVAYHDSAGVFEVSVSD